MSVLVVDDEVTLLKNIARSLRRDGVRVETAATGGAARSALGRGAVKAVCLDLQLPDCNGFELLAEIRCGAPAMPVIVITGAATAENRSQAERLGADAFLAKPFSLAALKQALEAARGCKR